MSNYKIFISYRVTDTQDAANSLWERLWPIYGEDAVFFDKARIQDQKWQGAINEAISTCKVFIVLVGNDWTFCRNANRTRRLLDPDDVVRNEIENALRRTEEDDQAVVIPVMVNGAEMPSGDVLPDEIVGLLECNWDLELRREKSNSDLGTLVNRIRQHVPPPATAAPRSEAGDAHKSVVPDITRSQDAWNQVRDAAEAGRFVPVLGLELSCDTDYGNAPRTVAEEYEQDPHFPTCPQATEMHRVELMKCELIEHLTLDSDGRRSKLDSGIHAGRWLQARADANDAVRLADFLRAWGGDSDCELPTAPVGSAEDEPRALAAQGRYLDLKLDTLCLAFALRKAWACWLSEDTTPLSQIELTATAPFRYAVAEDVHFYLAACVDHCAALRSSGWDEPHDLHLEWIYEKLLVLASQIFPADVFWDDAGLWSPGLERTFAGRHSKFIRDNERATNWECKARTPSVFRATATVGVRLLHALWAERLLDHMLLAGSRAYRSKEQLAFLMSLHEKITELPGLVADPFEVGLLYVDDDGQALAALKGVLEHAEAPSESSGLGRVPGAFHMAIARVIRHAAEGHASGPSDAGISHIATKCKTGTSAPSKNPQMVISLSLDREMERALERELDVYRLLVPVSIPLKGRAKSGSPKPRRAGTEDAWLYGVFRRSEESDGFVCESWMNVTGQDDDGRNRAQVAGEGPLLVKLFGSPLTDTPDVKTLDMADHYDEGKRISHRVVLDESELLRMLSGPIPSQVVGLEDALRGARMFFFGQDAITWSDRIPYLMMEQFGRESATHLDGTTSGASDRPTQLAQITAIGDAGTYGGSLFARVGIARNIGEDARDREVAEEIMEGVVRDGI